MTVRLIQGNALDELRKLPSESVHVSVCSPPYLGLRSYRIEPVTWPDGWTGHLGLEPSVDLFVQHLVSIFREVKRVLRSDGCCFVNLADSFFPGDKNPTRSPSVPHGGAYGIGGKERQCSLRPDCVCSHPDDAHQGGCPMGHIEHIAPQQQRSQQPDPTQDRGSEPKDCASTSPGASPHGVLESTSPSCNENVQDVCAPASVASVSPSAVKTNVADARQSEHMVAYTADTVQPTEILVRHIEDTVLSSTACPYYNIKRLASQSLKPLDLCGIPERFALAMQQDGWYWRDRIAWVKASPMPESVAGWTWQKCKVKVGKQASRHSHNAMDADPSHADMNPAYLAQWADCPGCDKCKDTGGYVLRKGSWRTTRAWEYIFMFAKTPDYFACQEQVREAVAPSTIGRGPVDFGGQKGRDYQPKDTDPNFRNGSEQWKRTFDYRTSCENGRNPRSWWLINSEPALWDFCLACGAWFGKGGWNRKSVKRWSETETEDGEPKTVHHAKCPNCQAVDQFVAHYALFPTDLPKRCILAATSDAGVCPKCGSQWAPVVEISRTFQSGSGKSGRKPSGDYTGDGQCAGDLENDIRAGPCVSARVLSYRATCTCPAHKPIPATVLDPFSGGASSGLAADRLGRSYIGIELSESYLALSKARLQADGPMMAGMEE